MFMNLNQNRNSRRLVALLMGLGLLFSSAPLLHADPPVAQNEAPTANEQEEPLELRYARAHLELAKLDLKRAEYWNQQIPSLISTRTIDFLRKHVEVDAEQLRQAQQTEYANVHQIYVRGAQAALELAEADLARKQATYKAVGGTYSALELDRAIAVANVARLNLERTLKQEDSLQTVSYLQWQLDELRNQILELQIKVESTPER